MPEHLYVTTQHSTLGVGQRWRCRGELSCVVVALDACPGGVVVNLLLETPTQRVLAPCALERVLPETLECVAEGVDVSEHLEDYQAWKALAQEGRAGHWSCDLAQVLEHSARG